ncbi:VOC family protein [Rossellomorea marisflavi]|uniref:VOC family protein n=1 Tax=Rossellomorea marisflavi TaxID=189381 RepID=UPI00279DA704|nr:VOC family protein [Rossellomorea marisflavi]UTE73724.1 VOC family protein [Rossellomorea marisflavi]
MIKGFGGIFWRSQNPEALKQWYTKVLGLDIGEWNGAIIKTEGNSETIFSLYDKEDEYFPKEQQVMVNFQVHDMEEVLTHLDRIGVSLAKEKQSGDFGQFVWIKDPDGRLIELWEK